MTDEPRDPELRAGFDALRRSMAEEGRIPPFEPMLEAARAEARRRPAPRRARPFLLWTPLAAAAAVAALFLLAQPASDADAEFERLVADYTQLAAGGTWRSPTASLLQTPGVDLGAVPTFRGALSGLNRPGSRAPDGRTP